MAALRKPSESELQLHAATLTKLREISRDEDRPMADIVSELIDRYQDEQFWKRIRDGYAKLKADPVGWESYQDEARLLEGGSMDGLEDEEPYYSEEEIAEIEASAKSQGW